MAAATSSVDGDKMPGGAGRNTGGGEPEVVDWIRFTLSAKKVSTGEFVGTDPITRTLATTQQLIDGGPHVAWTGG